MVTKKEATSQKVCLISLGCPKNQVDSEIMSAGLLQEGFAFVPDPSDADVIVLNSCSFIQDAVEESLEVLDSLIQYKLQGSCHCIVLAGCLVQRYGPELVRELPDIDLFLGMEAEEDIGALLSRHLGGETKPHRLIRSPSPKRLLSPPLSQSRPVLGIWAYAKIAEGCSNACSYCTLPSIRGPLLSRPGEEIYQEVANLADQGVVEINLIAQDIAAYGNDWKREDSHPLVDLLHMIHRIEGIRWIRLLYCHPGHLDKDLIDCFGNLPKLCPYLDLPIQHVSPHILKAMNRPYDEDTLRGNIGSLRTIRPDIALRTTVMVGFPGESERDFEQLLRFLEEIRFHHLGVFPYSPEEGTEAFKRRDSVPAEIKEARHNNIMELQAEISESIQKQYLGTIQEVLVEGIHEENSEFLKARTRYQAPEVDGVVLIDQDHYAHTGLMDVRITEAHTYDLAGIIFYDPNSS